ncbi:MAG: GNAT family protein [Pseudomonadota bacterium]
MAFSVREMRADELPLRAAYFHRASDELLALMGVDRSLLPAPDLWTDQLGEQLARPPRERTHFLLSWLEDGQPIGFSTADSFQDGASARIHLHVFEAGGRQRGVGRACLLDSVRLYFDVLDVDLLISEPHAFNTAPNRTLQSVGFRFVKTYKATPGPFNLPQTVNRWELGRDRLRRS